MKQTLIVFVCMVILLVSCARKDDPEVARIKQNMNTHVAEEPQSGAIGVASHALNQQQARTETSLNRTMFVNALAGLRVRDAPGLDGNRIGALDFGAEVRAIREDGDTFTIDNVEGKWMFVETDDLQGWIFGGFLSLSNDDVEPLPPPHSGIIIEWQKATTLVDFLLQFPSIFSRTGPLSYGGVLDETALIRIGWLGVYHDADGNWIREAPFIRRGWYAAGFVLLDINGDGIPEVVISHSIAIESSFIPYRVIFKYFEGEYRELRVADDFRWHLGETSLFTDETGRLIAFAYDHEWGGGYWHLVLQEDHIIFYPIALPNLPWGIPQPEDAPLVDWDVWVEHHENIWIDLMEGNPISIPGYPESQLVRVPRFIAMESEITETVRQRLGLQ